MNRRSKPLDKKGTTNAKWVHNFLNHKDDIIVEPTDQKGIKIYTVTSLTNLMQDDYVVKWAESGLNKTIYQVISATGVTCEGGKGNTGRIKDLIALDEVDSDAVHAILLVDRDAALQDLEEDDDGFGER